MLIERLWAFEAWRIQGDADDDDDGEYDLPSELGYGILQRVPTLVVSTSVDQARSLWRPIFALGPDGHVAIERFLNYWFLLLLKDHDAEQFLRHWRAMLDHGVATSWTTGRRSYRGRKILLNLLGLNAVRELSNASDVRARLPELEPFYRHWATTQMSGDEDDIAAFCNFLAAEAGKPFRLQGTLWLRDAIVNFDRFSRDSVGNALAEAMDVVLTQQATELLAKPDVRTAWNEIVATLVANQVPTAFVLQRRIRALR